MVRPARRRCPAPDCTTMISARYAFCNTHWYALPRRLRNEITNALQEDGTSAEERQRLTEEALEFLGAKRGKRGDDAA